MGLIWFFRTLVYVSSLLWVGWLANLFQVLLFPFYSVSFKLSYNVNACLATVIAQTSEFLLGISDMVHSRASTNYENSLLVKGKAPYLLLYIHDEMCETYTVQAIPPPMGLVDYCDRFVNKLLKGFPPLLNTLGLLSLSIPRRSKSFSDQAFDRALFNLKRTQQRFWMASVFLPQEVVIREFKASSEKQADALMCLTNHPSSVSHTVSTLINFQNVGSPYIYVLAMGSTCCLQRIPTSHLPDNPVSLAIWLGSLIHQPHPIRQPC